MFDQDLEEALATIRDRRPAHGPREIDPMLLTDVVHDLDGGTVTEEDAFRIDCDGITQINLLYGEPHRSGGNLQIYHISGSLKTSSSRGERRFASRPGGEDRTFPVAPGGS